MHRILERPYPNSFGGEDFFPPDVGPFCEVPLTTMRELLFKSHIDHSLLWVSTSFGHNFTQLNKNFEIDEFYFFLDNYTAYNCNEDSGKTLTFWVDIGDLKLSQYPRFRSEVLRSGKVSFTKIFLRYGITQP